MADNETNSGSETTPAKKGHSKAAAGTPRNRAASRGATTRSSSVSGASEEAMKKQIAELKREVGRLNRALSEQAEEVVETAQGWYDSAADRASGWYDSAAGRAARTAQQLRSQAQSVRGQAQSVSETVRQNPGTISTALTLGGLLGVLIGLAIAKTAEPQPDWFHRHWRN